MPVEASYGKGPKVVLVGAAKAGTTSLYKYFGSHPEIYVPPRLKEINFFTGVNPQVSSLDDYFRLYKDAQDNQVLCDISTAYLYDSVCAQKIFDTLGPKTKIIVMLRNPVAASFSLWKQIRHFGDEPLSFEDALEQEHVRINDIHVRQNLRGWAPNYFYTDRYLYAEQLKRYYKLFPAENIKVIIYEEFFSDIEFWWRDLCDFLGVNPDYKIPSLGKVYNKQSGGTRFNAVHNLIYGTMWWKRAITLFLPQKLKAFLRLWLDDWNKKAPDESDKLQEKTKRHLQELFRKDIEEVERLTNKPVKRLWESF